MELLTAFGSGAVRLINQALLMGLIFGVLILLRPVTNRLLRPRHRVCLWGVGWVLALFSFAWEPLVRFLRIPFSFRTLAIPRVEQLTVYSTTPMYLPTEVEADGTASLALPGGAEIPLDPDWLTWLLPLLGLAGLAIFLTLLVWSIVRERQLRRIARAGQRLDLEALKEYDADWTGIAVCLCPGLPTSFVYNGHYTGWNDGIRYVICLQRELPPERLALVLRHELTHIRCRHLFFKAFMSLVLAMAAWNPVLWLACRLTCRDMELACAQAVMDGLDERGRREYARTLVELASGRHLWGGVTCFGECDAALRVRRAAAWRPERRPQAVLSLLLALGLGLFLYCGGPYWQYPQPSQEALAAYLSDGAWVEEVRAELERPGWIPAHGWTMGDESLIVQDREGRWWLCNFLWDAPHASFERMYYVYEMAPNPNLTGRTPVF